MIEMTAEKKKEKESEKSPPKTEAVNESWNFPVVIENIRPQIDGGAFPAKTIAGRAFPVTADIYKDGHKNASQCGRICPSGSICRVQRNRTETGFALCRKWALSPIKLSCRTALAVTQSTSPSKT